MSSVAIACLIVSVVTILLFLDFVFPAEFPR